jgi:hemerythrin superfamily protein
MRLNIQMFLSMRQLDWMHFAAKRSFSRYFSVSLEEIYEVGDLHHVSVVALDHVLVPLLLAKLVGCHVGRSVIIIT